MLDGVLVENPGQAIVVAVGIDPNESAELVRSRALDHKSDDVLWVIAPKALSDALVAAHGPSVLVPPMAPIVGIDSEQARARLLPNGLKSRADILKEIADLK